MLSSFALFVEWIISALIGTLVVLLIVLRELLLSLTVQVEIWVRAYGVPAGLDKTSV